MVKAISRRLSLRVSLVALAAVLTLAVASSVWGLPLAQTGAPFSLDPATVSLEVGDVVTLSIRVGAGAQDVDTAQAFIDFNPSFLQVVDGSGNPATSITPGTVFVGSGGTWPEPPLINEVDNSAGRIRFGGSKGLSGMDATSDFALATVRFKALAAASSTQVTFDTTPPQATNAFLGGPSVIGAVSNATFTITSPPCAPPVSGDWFISADCSFSGSATAPGNVIVQANVTLTIRESASLNINFSSKHLKVRSGAKVVIWSGGKIH